MGSSAHDVSSRNSKTNCGNAGSQRLELSFDGEPADAININLDFPLPYGLSIDQGTLDENLRHDFAVETKAEF